MSFHKFEIFNNTIFFTVLILFPIGYTHLLADKDIDVFSDHTLIRKKRIEIIKHCLRHLLLVKDMYMS